MKVMYKIVRSDRKTISLEITREGALLVRAPKRMSASEIQCFVDSKSDWIQKHLEKRQRAQENLSKEGRYTKQEIEKMVDFAKAVIPQKVAYYARLLGVTYGRITIRNQKTRWGSCTSTGNLNFNCLLVMMPPEILDYVVVHELCHRFEMNHSAKFWARVGQMMPDYRVRRKWLKDNGNKFMIRMHGEG